MKTQIKINHLSKTFNTLAGPKKALDDVSLEIAEGECVVIGGENGSGKSVLMQIIAGLMDGDNHTVVEPVETTMKFSSVFVDGRVGLVFQEAETQILGETPAEDIAFGPKNLGWKKEEVQEAVREALEQTGLTDKADFPARFLSGGEKRRLAVACMLAMKLPTIILDEPYANLDFGGVKQMNKLIRQLKAEGKTVIILTHEIEKCLGLADRFVVLFRGKKVFDGTSGIGLRHNLEAWNIRNPLVSYSKVEDLIWE
ncbi:biotin transport system ATP-binding protein [Treponema bryantii]|uniref:Biotin transport system ATP-binding protein n=1 Tax=Treponema bryantii TaxID=163 RepID=A0A1I3I187_9SPIR|nr:ABC transporter ATP-binding protein [Treponema bryantii]SFI41603.1 biotin transport system ATP-binding protein [Treponema bryantii]